MDYSKLATFDFLFSLGYVTLSASIMTMIVTEVVKLILKATKVLTPNINQTKKDIILSRTGRIAALVIYALFYVIDIVFIKKTTLVIDIAFFASLLSGSTLTLFISKGIYTALRQMSKKSNVFEKLEVAQKTIFKLNQELKEFCVEQKSNNKAEEESANENQNNEVSAIEPKTITTKKWVIKGE